MEFMIVILASVAIVYCCGLTFAFGVDERKPFIILMAVFAFAGLQYFIWR
jgi:hypothetical protein